MPPARKRQLSAAADRMRPGSVLALLRRAARLDRVNKGAAPGRSWEELVRLAVDTADAARPRTAGR
jgi:DNA polymerase-3 subunit delta